MNQFSKVAAEDMARPWVSLALIVIPIVGCADAADDSKLNAVMLNADAGTQRTMDPGLQIDIQDERQADPRTPSEAAPLTPVSSQELTRVCNSPIAAVVSAGPAKPMRMVMVATRAISRVFRLIAHSPRSPTLGSSTSLCAAMKRAL